MYAQIFLLRYTPWIGVPEKWEKPAKILAFDVLFNESQDFLKAITTLLNNIRAPNTGIIQFTKLKRKGVLKRKAFLL